MPLLLLYQPAPGGCGTRAAAAAPEALQPQARPAEGGLLILWCAGRWLYSTSLSGTLPESIGNLTQLEDM